jgi:hypothetical protein
MKDSFYEELECVIDEFPQYHTKILLGDFSAKIGREDICKPTTANENLHESSIDTAVRVVNFAISKNLSKIQCSYIVTFINLLGHLTEKKSN